MWYLLLSIDQHWTSVYVHLANKCREYSRVYELIIVFKHFTLNTYTVNLNAIVVSLSLFR